MIDDDAGEDGLPVPFARSYDYFKYMTGIALLSLGGIFAFADGGGTQFEKRQVVILVTFIGLAGVTSLLMAASLATLEVKPEPQVQVVRKIRIGQTIVSMSLSVGLGGFVFNFISAMFK